MNWCPPRATSPSTTPITPSKLTTADSRPGWPLRGLKRLRSARVISTGHAFIQNLRRGHYELGVDADPRHQLSAAFAELALAV